MLCLLGSKSMLWHKHRKSTPTSVEAVRAIGHPVIRFSETVEAELQAIRSFLFDHMYRAPRVMAERERVGGVVQDLFPLFLKTPSHLPADWHPDVASAKGPTALARIVADYIAGMTDRFALQTHSRLVGPLK